MARENELPILTSCYGLVLATTESVAKFPRSHRFVLGERMERQVYAILEDLVRAKYASAKKALLEAINLELEVLRFQVRLAKDTRCLSLKGYGSLSERITNLGKQLGGWRRHAAQ